MDNFPLHYQTLTDLADRIRKGEITSTQLTENILGRIDSLDGRLNAFKLLCPDLAIEQARAADQECTGFPMPLRICLMSKGCPRQPVQNYWRAIPRQRIPGRSKVSQRPG